MAGREPSSFEMDKEDHRHHATATRRTDNTGLAGGDGVGRGGRSGGGGGGGGIGALAAPLLGDHHHHHVDEEGDYDMTRKLFNAPNYLLHSVSGVVVGIILYVIGLQLVDRTLAVNCTGVRGACGYTGCYGRKEFAGTLITIVSIPITVLSAGFSTYSLVSRYRIGATYRRCTRLIMWSLAATCLVVTFLSWLLLLKPWYIFDGGYGKGWHHYGLVDQFFGGFVAVLAPALGFVFARVSLEMSSSARTRAAMASVSACHLSPSGLTSTANFAPLEPTQYRHNFRRIWLLVVVLVVALLCTACFSAVYNYSAQSYFPAVSPFAYNWKWNENFVFKMYPDVMVFYLGFIVLIVLGCIGHFVPSVRALLHRRLRVPGNPASKFHPFPVGVSVGELLVVACVLALYSYWLWYWRYHYTRIKTESQKGTHAILQVWARVFGHFSNLSFALLLLPAARNSMWESVFGMPFERAVKYHRMLGSVAYMSVTTHMAIWFVKWNKESLLWHNMWTYNDLQISPANYAKLWVDSAWECVGVIPHWDNWTIPVNIAAWLVLTVMVSLAVFMRRKNYEMFHYVHHFAWIYYIVALAHAWSFWYYACGGLMLYMLDRCMRLFQGASSTATVSLDHVAGVTCLKLPAQFVKFYAGQYAFVNVPAVSELQWHPFTISSAPSSSQLSFHIRDMGPNTWTSRLAALADAHAMTEVRVDGPYGRTAPFSDKRVLLLLCGGIGVTPMHSILSELHSRFRAGASIGNLERVSFVWSARSDAMFALFSQTFHSIHLDSHRGVFSVALHNSRHGAIDLHELALDDTPADSLAYTQSIIQRGRPALAETFAQFSMDYAADDVMVMVCGPKSLILSASSLAFRYGFSFHSETFHF